MLMDRRGLNLNRLNGSKLQMEGMDETLGIGIPLTVLQQKEL